LFVFNFVMKWRRRRRRRRKTLPECGGRRTARGAIVVSSKVKY
jgi:hypothetical protein